MLSESFSDRLDRIVSENAETLNRLEPHLPPVSSSADQVAAEVDPAESIPQNDLAPTTNHTENQHG